MFVPLEYSDENVGIALYMLLGFALLGFVGIGFSCILDGWGDFYRLRPYGTDGVTLCIFLCIGVVRALVCIYRRVYAYAAGARDSLRTFVLDIRDVEGDVDKE
jgi:hypothetical protein